MPSATQEAKSLMSAGRLYDHNFHPAPLRELGTARYRQTSLTDNRAERVRMVVVEQPADIFGRVGVHFGVLPKDGHRLIAERAGVEEENAFRLQETLDRCQVVRDVVSVEMNEDMQSKAEVIALRGQMVQVLIFDAMERDVGVLGAVRAGTLQERSADVVAIQRQTLRSHDPRHGSVAAADF